MGHEGMIKNLSKLNIRRDEGCIPIGVINKLEKLYNIVLSKLYVDFVTVHNGARLFSRIFNYFDTPRQSITSNSIAFLNVEQIEEDTNDLLGQNEEGEDPPYFENGLVPFGENGGGDFICFDYRQDPKTNNPSIILWSHDVADNSQRISFIANSFEEFINMLYEPDDED